MTPEIRYMYMYIVYIIISMYKCVSQHSLYITITTVHVFLFTQVTVQRKIVCAVWQNTSRAHHRHIHLQAYILYMYTYMYSAIMASYTSTCIYV